MIYPATLAHWDEIQEIYAIAREFMRQNGNPTQWEDWYPAHETTRDDITKGQLYLYEENGRIQGVFAHIEGDDPDYAVIDGAWLDDGSYAAIHRVASRGEVRGVVGHCIRWSLMQSRSVRIDTHADNIPMQRALTRLGFTKCGTITMAYNGTLRTAFQYATK